MYDYIAGRSFIYSSENFLVSMENNFRNVLNKIDIYSSIKNGHEEED
jgi:hypothetical protein